MKLPLLISLKRVEASKQIDDSQLLSDARNHVSYLFLHSKNYEKAFEYAQMALYSHQEEGRKGGIADSYELIGIIRRSQEEYDEALEYFSRSLRLREALNSSEDVLDAHKNLALTYAKIHQTETATKHLGRALELSKQLGNKSVQLNLLTCFSEVSLQSGEPRQGLVYAQKAVESARRLNQQKELAEGIQSIGKSLCTTPTV